MDCIELEKSNNFLIFGPLECINAVPVLKELKGKAENFKFTYISFSNYASRKDIVVSGITDQHEIINENLTYQDLFRSLSKEALNLICSQSAEFEIGFNLTIVINAFLDIDSDMQRRLVEADYSENVDVSRKTIKVAGRLTKDVEIINYKNLHEFDDFTTRMLNFKDGTQDEFINLMKFYSRLTK